MFWRGCGGRASGKVFEECSVLHFIDVVFVFSLVLLRDLFVALINRQIEVGAHLLPTTLYLGSTILIFRNDNCFIHYRTTT